MSRLPKFFAARAAVEEALSALARASVQLRAEGESQQHPMYYRANQFWRQLDEFRVEIDRCAQANAVGGDGSDGLGELALARVRHRRR